MDISEEFIEYLRFLRRQEKVKIEGLIYGQSLLELRDRYPEEFENIRSKVEASVLREGLEGLVVSSPSIKFPVEGPNTAVVSLTSGLYEVPVEGGILQS